MLAAWLSAAALQCYDTSTYDPMISKAGPKNIGITLGHTSLVNTSQLSIYPVCNAWNILKLDFELCGNTFQKMRASSESPVSRIVWNLGRSCSPRKYNDLKAKEILMWANDMVYINLMVYCMVYWSHLHFRKLQFHDMLFHQTIATIWHDMARYSGHFWQSPIRSRMSPSVSGISLAVLYNRHYINHSETVLMLHRYVCVCVICILLGCILI